LNLSRTRDVQQYANRQAKHKAKETRNEGHHQRFPQMDYAGGVKFGIMLAEMDGSETDTQAAIAWLKEKCWPESVPDA
jgi:hypothetical protein